MPQEAEKKKRVAITTTFLPERHPQLQALVEQFKGTSQLSAKMRDYLLAGLNATTPQDNDSIADEIAQMRAEMALLRRDLADLGNKIATSYRSETPVDYDATRHNDDEGVDINSLDGSVVANLRALGQ